MCPTLFFNSGNRSRGRFLLVKRVFIDERARKNALLGDFGAGGWVRTNDQAVMSRLL